MKKIVILGCENSHAEAFLEFIKKDPGYPDIEVIGVYSDEAEPAKALGEKFGVAVMEDYADGVGKVDAVMVPARHGDNHLKYALPYIESGVPMFIDKPFTVSEDEAIELVTKCKAANVRLTGGSSLRHDPYIQELKADATNKVDGETLGGTLRAPLASDSAYGGFYFYAGHLTEMVLEVFGKNPKSVKAYSAGKQITVVFRYGAFDVTGVFVEHGYSCYYASRYSENTIKGQKIDLANSPCFKLEFEEFYNLLCGKEMTNTYSDFVAPVFVMNAIKRSIDSGNEEIIKEYEL
jgi:predicted dehydrogenase